ncbi:Major facilitator superfamily (MFS) profile domain-containing protein [[Candida] zeylanoides]
MMVANADSSPSVPMQELDTMDTSPSGQVPMSAISTTDNTTSSIEVEHESNSEVESEDETFFPDGGLQAYLVLAGSFIGLIANFGMLNSVGVIQTYISIHQLEHVKTSTVSWIFSIYFALSFFGGIVVGPFFDARGAQIPLAAGLVLIFGGFMATANCNHVWQFIMALSVCVALGNTLCITPLVGVVSHWFYSRRGRAIGFATTGGSVGGIIIPLMLRALYPKVGFAWAMRILAFFCLACMLLAIGLARGRLEVTKRNNNTLSRTSTASSETAVSRVKRAKRFLSGTDVRYFDFTQLKDVKYSLLIAGVFTEELSLMLMVTYLSSYALKQNMSESNSYLLLTVFNATGVPGRWIPGYASDILGHFNVMILMLIGLCLSIFCLLLPFGSNHSVLWAFSALGGFFSSSILSLTPVCLGSITPVSRFGSRYGMLYFFVSIGNLFGLPIGAAIIGNKSTHNYDMFVLLCGILALVGTVCWMGSRYCSAGFNLNVKV